jgi:hypothetical protein
MRRAVIGALLAVCAAAPARCASNAPGVLAPGVLATNDGAELAAIDATLATSTDVAALGTEAQTPPAEKPPDCRKCHSTGKLVCPLHPRSECELETDDVVYCSAFIDCPQCGGTGYIPCTECKNAPALAALDARRQKLQTRKIALKSIDDTMGRALRKAESAHFVLMWEMDHQKIDKKYLNAHECTHVYLKRLEQEFADYCARLEITDKEFADKSWVFVWYLPDDHRDGALKFCGQQAEGGVKLMGLHPRYSVCGNKQHFNDDDKLHRNIVHCVAHLLLSAQAPPAWIGNIKAGWADEGLAHWFEDRYFGICDNYCYQEANANNDFKSGKFRLAVRKMVASNEAPPIADVFQQNIDTLTLPMNAAVFSYVDFLLFKDGAKFNELVKKLKAKVPSRDALRDVFGMSPIEFETQWKAWVLATYPKM